jgi:hypothetical protein
MKSSKKSAKIRKPLHRHWSGPLVDESSRAQSRAMLHAVGFERGDFAKSQIGIASTWSQVTPCNIHIDKLAIAAAEGVAKAGSKALIFNTITISDGISMGTQGMKYSLVSRLRQEHAGLPHRDCAAEPAGGVCLWRHDFAGVFPESGRRYRVGVRGGGGACGGQDERS